MVKRVVHPSPVRPLRRGASRTPDESSAAVTDRDIACRAFLLYCERGCEHGHDADDWLEAERELRAVSSTP
jgi:hypothetical protein